MRKKSRIALLCMIWCVCLSDGERKEENNRGQEREEERQRTPLSREFERGQSIGWMK
jgi:hypothetical protein